MKKRILQFFQNHKSLWTTILGGILGGMGIGALAMYLGIEAATVISGVGLSLGIGILGILLGLLISRLSIASQVYFKSSKNLPKVKVPHRSLPYFVSKLKAEEIRGDLIEYAAMLHEAGQTETQIWWTILFHKVLIILNYYRSEIRNWLSGRTGISQ